MLNECKDEHAPLGDETHRLLIRHGAETKDPHPVVRVMSDMKIRVKMMSPSEHNIADVMTDGCDMGIKSLTGFINKYKRADQESRQLATKLIGVEEALEKGLRGYL